MHHPDSPMCRSRIPSASAFLQRLGCAVLLLCTVMQTACTSTSVDTNAQLRADLDAAIERAADYLESQQDGNGAWPSQTYGLFRDGVALTPHVLRSLAQADRSNETMRNGFGFLAQQVVWTRSHPSRPIFHSAVQGPVYFIADTQLAVNQCREKASSTLHSLHVGLPRLQIRDDNTHTIAQEGGWGYSNRAFGGVPIRFDAFRNSFDHGRSTAPIFPDLSANISSTAYALDAIPLPASYLTGHGEIPVEYTQMIEAALRFAARCQNFGTADDRFDDGGFFFNPADAARNKGGPAGTDANGYARFHASGSSTADGLRVLLRCLVPKDDPRVLAARNWLFMNFDAEHNPGTFNDDRVVLRDAYYFYYAASVADTFTLLGDSPDNWAQDLVAALLKKQQPNGAFANLFTDGKEDDPLIATPFALRAMLACRDAMTRESP